MEVENEDEDEGGPDSPGVLPDCELSLVVRGALCSEDGEALGAEIEGEVDEKERR